MDIGKIKQIQEQIEKFRFNNEINSVSEAGTKEYLIKPFFEALGWQFSNPKEVIPEETDPAGKRADYCLCRNGEPKMLVEAKALKNPLNDNSMILNKLNYCANKNIPLLIITNGDNYKVFFSKIQGTGAGKFLFEFSLSGEIEPNKISKLEKEFVQSDELLNYGKKGDILQNIRNAVESLIQKAEFPFVNLVQNKIHAQIGSKYQNDEVKEALKSLSVSVDIQNEDVAVGAPSTGTSANKTSINSSNNNMSKTKSAPVEPKLTGLQQYFKQGTQNKSFHLFNQLLDRLKYEQLNFDMVPMSHFINFKVARTHIIFQILPKQKFLNLHLHLLKTQLTPEGQEGCRDISKIGKVTAGNTEYKIEEEKDLDKAILLIKEASEFELNRIKNR
ncbi:MAG: hypothetical protein LC102_10190 [Ignavibacteriales bacterium]|jgi:Predicted type IV restriction endonuclease|nr:MAG: hypothetical protein F9K26_11870 [Ignavibacteriaceae bacterium]MBW7873553.1 hypothetical protein [Ignavibacteria bacterium]MCZ2143784.1 hypothetical protein [Ignavibacteriales bacterium]OQY70034.1 MAG: hypothetical protein B6D45_11910 [Ignavibacteriales bacterium UTCHB3]MBV6445945.1 hypothetical protein [Ignavibacteriaceae bacterium]